MLGVHGLCWCYLQCVLCRQKRHLSIDPMLPGLTRDEPGWARSCGLETATMGPSITRRRDGDVVAGALVSGATKAVPPLRPPTLADQVRQRTPLLHYTL